MVEQKPKLKQKETARKRAENTTMAAQKCATQKKFRHLCRTKSIDVYYFKERHKGRTTDNRINDVSPRGFIR